MLQTQRFHLRWRRALALAATATIAMAAVATVAGPARAAGGCTIQSSWGTNDPQAAAEVLRLVNEHRAGIGLGPLVSAPSLERSAIWKSGHMLEYDYFDHSDPAPPAARGVGERLRDCGYTGSTWSENIAFGYRTPAAAMDAWLNSPGHRRNIEGANYTAVGISAVARSGRPIYWTQNFGVANRDGTPVPTPTPPAPPPPSAPAPPPTPRVDPVPVPPRPQPAPTPPATSAPGKPPAALTPPGARPPSVLKPAVTVPTRRRPVVIRRRASLRPRRSKAVRFVVSANRSVVVSVRSRSGRGARAARVRLHCNGKRLAVARARRGKAAIIRRRIDAGRCAVMTVAGKRRVKAQISIVVRPPT